MNFCRKLACLVVCLALPLPLQAGIVYNEEMNGPGAPNGVFSRDNNNPTLIPTLGLGSNRISGIVEDSAGPPQDRDFYTIVIPNNMILTSVYNTLYSSSDEFAFMGMDIGSTFPYAQLGFADPVDLSLFIGGTLLGPDVRFEPSPPNPPNTLRNLLPIIGSGANGTQIGTFTTLGPGTYTVWVQQTGDRTEYELEFNLTAVPEPSSALLALSSVGLLAMRRRR